MRALSCFGSTHMLFDSFTLSRRIDSCFARATGGIVLESSVFFFLHFPTSHESRSHAHLGLKSVGFCYAFSGSVNVPYSLVPCSFSSPPLGLPPLGGVQVELRSRR